MAEFVLLGTFVFKQSWKNRVQAHEYVRVQVAWVGPVGLTYAAVLLML